MTEKRFERIYADVDVFCKDHNAKEVSQLIEREDYDRIVDLLNCLNEENKQLKQFQEQVASVIEGKMGDNVCNDYKMEVLKEIWNELELDEVWFE